MVPHLFLLVPTDNLVGWWADPEFLRKDLGFNLLSATVPPPATTTTTITTPFGPITSSLPLKTGPLPKPFALAEGQGVGNVFKVSVAAGSTEEWLTLTFPAGTKAAGLNFAPDACAVSPEAVSDFDTTALFDVQATVAFRNLKYNWDQTPASMPPCAAGESAAAGSIPVGSYVGVYVSDVVADSITQLRIRVPRFDDGRPVPMLIGGIHISVTVPSVQAK